MSGAGSFLHQALMEAGYPRVAAIACDGPAMYWMRLDYPPTVAEVAAVHRAFDLWYVQHPEQLEVDDRISVEEWHASIHQAWQFWERRKERVR